jgi:hypothetical protein
MKSFESIARNAYQVFCSALQYSPAVLVTWQQLPQKTRDAWIAAARNMADEIQNVH